MKQKGEKKKEKRLNDGQKEQESLEKEKYCLEEEARTSAHTHSLASAWWRRIRVSPTPRLGGFIAPLHKTPAVMDSVR